jgi:hypothetical protein
MIDREFLLAATLAIEEDKTGPCLHGELHRLNGALLLPPMNEQLPTKLHPPLQLVVADLWDVLTIIWRVEWQRELARDRQLDDTQWMYFAAADVREFHVGLRSLYNHVAWMIPHVALKHGQVPWTSFRKLRNWTELPANAARLGELGQLIQACSWFDVLRTVRDSIVHDGAKPVVFPQLEKISFQVYSANLRGLRIEPLMLNENLLDFELYAAVLLGQTIGFLEKLAAAILGKYQIPTVTAQFRHYHPALRVLKQWIDRVPAAVTP